MDENDENDENDEKVERNEEDVLRHVGRNYDSIT